MSDRALPSPMLLLQGSFDAFMANPAGYLLAGLGPTLIVLPITFAVVFVAYGGIFLGMVPGLLLENEVVAILGAIGVFVLAVVGAIAALMILVAPLYASLMRSIDASREGVATLGFGAPFSSVAQDLPKVLGVYTIVGVLGLLGALMCYLPGILVAFVLEFAVPAVVLDRVGPAEGVKRSVAHVLAYPGWSAAVFGISMAIMMILSQIPFVGTVVAAPLAFDFQIRAYRAAFGGTGGNA